MGYGRGVRQVGVALASVKGQAAACTVATVPPTVTAMAASCSTTQQAMEQRAFADMEPNIVQFVARHNRQESQLLVYPLWLQEMAVLTVLPVANVI